MAQSLAAQIAASPGQPSSVRIGTVTGVSPTQVSVQGTVFEDVGTLGSYVPLEGDVVALLGQSSASGSDPTSWLILGTLGAPTAQAGDATFSFVAQTGATTPVVFAEPFVTQPSVATNINSGVGATANWNSRAFGVTRFGFTLFVFGPSSTWTNVNVQWQAQVQTQ